MSVIVEVDNLRKTYAGGFEALKGVSLDIREGEVLALLGPNGAGKTTLISTICGITEPSSGTVQVGGHDIKRDFRAARSLIGLVPQEITLEMFAKVKNTVAFSRGLFGKRADPDLVMRLLEQLSLGDKADAMTMMLSGGMKRRVLIAKALAHEPRVLFLDEPTAGVDVELRKGMWDTVAALRDQGVTIILTTHYIEEAEAMADRIAVINQGQILLVEDKATLMARMGQKHLHIDLCDPITAVPEGLSDWDLSLAEGGARLTYTYDTTRDRSGITRLLNDLAAAGVAVHDVETKQSNLEEIFVSLVKEGAA